MRVENCGAGQSEAVGGLLQTPRGKAGGDSVTGTNTNGQMPGILYSQEFLDQPEGQS